jgi:hypothetical protein
VHPAPLLPSRLRLPRPPVLASLPPLLAWSSSCWGMDLSRLDLRPGVLFEADVWRRFSSPVCPGSPCSPSAFWLVVSFGRCIFRLDPVSVGHILQAAFGGSARGFMVLSLADRVFRFTVSSRDVGFHIYNSRCIVRSEFKTFFNLWNSGGPNWNYELKLFLQEENANWWLVSGRKKISFADVVRRPPLTGANAVPVRRHLRSSCSAGKLIAPRTSVFNRLGFPFGAQGPRSPATSSTSGASPRDLHRGIAPPAGFPRLNGCRTGRGCRGCGDCSFSNSKSISNSTVRRPWSRRLQWRPILRNGPLRPGLELGRMDLSGSASSAFLCLFCKARGHLELFCKRKKSEFGFPLSSFPSFESFCPLEGSPRLLDFGSWFRSSSRSLTGGTPPSFASFGEFAEAVLLLKKSEQAPDTSLELALGVTSTKPQPASPPLALRRSSENLSMAYRRVDPGPFLPPGFSAAVVQHRGIMVRSVSQRLPPFHEDWAIINIHPLPEHEVLFPAVRDVVREYLVEHHRVGVRAIQRSHLGQVLVQFRSVLERDNLVLLGPQQYLDATFTAVRHNDAWNHRALLFNHECWLMLLGFPLDYRSSEYLQAAIGSFGRLILWEEDRSNISRTLLRVRVTSLEEVPQFIVFSEAEGFAGDSWTVQCEIIQQLMLAGQAQDEDPIPPAPEDGHQLPLAFFGLGQPLPPAGLDLNFPPEPEGGVLPAQQDDLGQGEWDQWIVNEQHIQQDLQPPLPNEQHIQQDELQHSNQHSGLSSDSSFGAGQLAPPANGHFAVNGHAMIGNGMEINAAPFNGPQEVDGPAPQVDQAQDLEVVPNNNQHQNLEMNFMLHQDWQPDPVFQMVEERNRAVQFSRLWAKFFAPAGSTDHSVGVPEKWAPFFLSNLLQPESCKD